MIKTFRGLLGDGGQNKIRLSTKKGKIGYRIVKLQIITETPGIAQMEHIVKIYKVSQGSVDGEIDFSDGNLLGVAEYSAGEGVEWPAGTEPVIFDQEVFNQDIYVTAIDVSSGSASVNYYIELETMNLSDNAAAVSTLRDIRLNPQVGA